jgi:S1-C subfamily serine protease
MKHVILLLLLCSCGDQSENLQNVYLEIPPVADYSAEQQATAGNCLPKSLQVVAGSIDYYSFTANVAIATSGKTNGLCTAGFIRENRLITAAHCIKDVTEIRVMLGYTDVYAESWEVHPDATDVNASPYASVSATDVGIITLSPETVALYKSVAEEINVVPRSIAGVGTHVLKPGECFAWAGYGRNILNQTTSSDGVRRVGSNLARGVLHYKGYPAVYSQISPEKVVSNRASMFGKGDSGAPIYNVNGEVIGVVSAYWPFRSSVVSIFADVTNPKTRSFIYKE